MSFGVNLIAIAWSQENTSQQVTPMLFVTTQKNVGIEVDLEIWNNIEKLHMVGEYVIMHFKSAVSAAAINVYLETLT